MATNPKNSEAKSFVSKFAKTLLGATCLTAVTGGAAMAGTISYTEGVGGQPSDYPNTFGTAYSDTAAALPGTTNITGVVYGGDQYDFIELTNLGAGTFTVSARSLEGGDATVFVYNTSDTLLEGGGSNQSQGAGFFTSTPLDLGALTIPGNGDLIIGIERYHEAYTNYEITVTTETSGVPEPSTVSMVGLGFAGALTLARKRRKQ